MGWSHKHQNDVLLFQRFALQIVGGLQTVSHIQQLCMHLCQRNTIALKFVLFHTQHELRRCG